MTINATADRLVDVLSLAAATAIAGVRLAGAPGHGHGRHRGQTTSRRSTTRTGTTPGTARSGCSPGPCGRPCAPATWCPATAGEEFVIAFPGLSVEAAARALGRIQEQLVLVLPAGTVPPFTASVGVAHATDGDNLEDLCRVADVALFRAKREGRNRVVVDHGPAPAASTSAETDG